MTTRKLILSKSSRPDLEWAKQILRRHEQIKAGTVWVPQGWNGWHLHLFPGRYDRKSVCAIAQNDQVPPLQKWLPFVNRVRLSALRREIVEQFEAYVEIQEQHGLEEFCQQPTPVLPTNLIKSLYRDLRDISYCDVGHARAIMKELPLCSDNAAVSRWPYTP